MTDPCRSFRELASAATDGEAGPNEVSALRAHTARCVGCRQYEAQLGQLRAASRLHAADDVPDLTAEILLAASSPPSKRVRDLRLLVAVVGAVQLLVAGLSLATSGDPSEHLLRDLASWEIALGGALLYVAWRPVHAAGLLPMVGLIGVVGLVSGVLDLATGVANAVRSLSHLTAPLTFVLLWQLARTRPLPHARPRRVPHGA